METPTQEPEAVTIPHSTFDSMELSPEVRRALIDDMKYTAPTLVQSTAFGPIREGKDVVVQSRTGTGKTAAFGIPLADRIDPSLRAPQMLVLAPTRELASQDGTELERINIHRGNRVLNIYGGAAFGPQLEGLKAGVQIIAGTPGRILDHLRRGTLKLDQVKYLVLDEADEMLSMGFQDELENILEFVPRGKPGDTRTRAQTMLFSATFPPEIKRMIDKHLVEPMEITLSSGNISVDKITHYYYVTSHMRKPSALLTVIEYEEPDSAIIFTNTREDANFIGGFLKNRGFDAEVLTGELTQSAREKVMKKIKAGNLQYLVATDVAARGIDINDLSHVFNYNLPESPEVYVHRTGRTGRAGKTGTAVSIVSGLDISTLYALTKWMKIAVEERQIPTETEVRSHKLDREVKKLVLHVRGQIEDGKFAEGGDNRFLQIAERVLTQPQAREIVATLLEKTLAAPAAARVEQVRPMAPEAGTPRVAGASVADAATVAPPAPEVEVSAEQREFEEQQMRKARGGAGSRSSGPRESRGGPREARGGRGERGGAERGGRESRGPRDERPARPARSAAGAPREAREPREPRPASSAPREERSAPVGDSKTLMVTLGRRNKMGAREVGLFVVNAAGIDVGQILDVRVRDNYSFVDVAPAVADDVIAKVTGKEHEGRPVKAELARKQRGEAPDAPAAAAAAAATDGATPERTS